MTSFKLFAPAKVNLYLAVLAQRKDGYHDLCTLFQRISLCDVLSVRVMKKNPENNILKVSGAKLCAIRSNLVCRAYAILRNECPQMPYLRIHLKKNIPIAAGLGGGSSDAGTFLFGVNNKLNLGLSKSRLRELAARLGADVPFFASGFRTALGTERGDRIVPKRFIGKFWFVIISFANGLPTKEIYKLYDASYQRPYALTKAKHDVNILSKYLLQKDLSQVAPRLRNDLQVVSERLKPAIKRVLSFMAEQGVFSLSVSGSGPTCFAILPSRKGAEQLQRKIRKRFHLKTYVSQSF